MELEFFASCLRGFEQLLARELESLGIRRVRPLGGGVAFFCDAASALRVCLWSRLASRVMLIVARVNAADADLLYAGAYDVAWEDVIAGNAAFAVRAHGTNDELRNTRFTSLKVKDAIADRLRAYRASKSQEGGTGPRVSIDVRIRENRATISLDFAGQALNHRPYLSEDDNEDAALSCSLAAGALAAGGWDALARAGAPFVDPACRDGMLIVEAASIACDLAPGLHRQKWGFAGWSRFDAEVWERLVDEAVERFEAGLARVAGSQALEVAQSAPPNLERVRFAGASTSSPSISKARGHVRRAGLRQVVTVELADADSVGELVERVSNVAARHRAGGAGGTALMVACNVDARTRSDSTAHVQADESAFVAACAAAGEGSRFAVVGGQDISSRFGRAPEIRLKVGAGRVETQVEVFDGAPEGACTIVVEDLAGGAPHEVGVLEQSSGQFAARLRKVFKERRKWAAREGVGCFRVYDADLPDYAVAIDVYTGAGEARGNVYLHIAEYAPPASVDADKARRRFLDVLAIAPVVCGVRPDHVFSKTRVREKGGGQYRNAGSRPYRTSVEEGGYTFEVDLAGRLDTGIFLDHRETRKLIGSRAHDVRFLNLFAYTGTASVYAAGGGARTTTTVDLSQTYLDWARSNMAANGFAGDAHQFVKSDVAKWITEARRSGKRFDLIFVDPPTFSNSKSMGKRTWDVQRDHVELLIGVSRLLSEEGIGVFSCNLRSFKPNLEELARYDVELEDISAETIPPDFARTPKIHKCYLVRHAVR